MLNTGDWLKDLVGIKYIPNGRDPENGFFCCGLVEWVQTKRGKPMPELSIEPEIWRTVFDDMGWPCEVERYDVIIFDTPKGAHVAVAVSSSEMIHAWEQAGQVVQEPIRRRAGNIRTVARAK